MIKATKSLFNQYPSVKLSLFTLPGIAAAAFTLPGLQLFVVIIAVLLLASIILLLTRARTFSYFAVCFALGFYIGFVAFGKNDIDAHNCTPVMDGIFEGRIVQILKTDSTTQTAFVAEGRLDAKELPVLEGQRVIINAANPGVVGSELMEGITIVVPVKVRIPQKKTLPGEMDEEAYARYLDARWYATADAGAMAIRGGTDLLAGLRYDAVTAVNDRIDVLFHPNSKELVKSMLTGDRSGLTKETKQAYSLTGTVHVLSISGLHVGIIAYILFFFLSIIGRPWIKFLIFIVMTGTFVFLTGMQPPALRAAVMASVFMLAVTVQRKANMLNILAFTAYAIVLADPPLIAGFSFQLSFLSVLGITLFYKPLRERLNLLIRTRDKAGTYLIDTIAVGIATSVTISIVIALNFGFISFISIIANILVIPMMMGGLVFSVVSLLFSLISIDIALIYSAVSDFLIVTANYLVTLFSGIDALVFRGPLSIVLSILFPIAVLYLTLSASLRAFSTRFATCALVFLSVLFIVPEKEALSSDTRIYPRRHMVLLEKPLSDSLTLVYMADRKPSRYNYSDRGVLDYLIAKEGRLLLAYSGRLSRSIADSVAAVGGCRACSLNYRDEKILGNLLNLKEGLYRIIDLDWNEKN